jgi:hypothetical protein
LASWEWPAWSPAAQSIESKMAMYEVAWWAAPRAGESARAASTLAMGTHSAQIAQKASERMAMSCGSVS